MSRARMAAAMLLAACPLAGAGAAGDLDLAGVTFVSSNGSHSELIVRASRARLTTDGRLADLDDVQVRVPDSAERTGFELSCLRGRIDLVSNDFWLEGDVEGRDAAGRVLRTEWLAWDESEGLLYGDAPVTVDDASARYRARALRYHAHERRLQLTGGVIVIQGQP